jgi:hypothetical protein
MASTYTDLGIELMATGENAGTWGTKTNANLNLIEQLTGGLNGSNRMVMGPAKHIVVGTDLLSDFSEFSLWYSIDDDKLKHRVVTKLGVQCAYPEFWVSNNQA